MKKFASIILLLFLSLSLCSCGGDYRETTVFALDTFITFHLKADAGELKNVTDCISESEKQLFSRTEAASELYALNNASEYTPSPELYALIEYSLELSRATGGAFDITAASLSDLWDVTSENPRVPTDAEISSALENTGYEKLTLSGGTVSKPAGVKLDLGAIAKGYIAQQTVIRLREEGVTTGFVSFGGNIAVVGAKADGSAWNIGIKDPRNSSAVLGTVLMSDGYLSVSGDYERYFMYENVRYHHIFDVSSGYPAKSGIISAAVIGYDGALCDALSTAVFVMGKTAALELYESGVYEFEMILCFEDHTVYATPGAGFSLTSAEWKYAG